VNYLLDTNVISELKRPKPNENVVNWFSKKDADSLYLSVLTLGEIRKGIEKMPDGQRKSSLITWLEKDIRSWFGSHLLTVDLEVADCWGKLQAQSNRPLPAIDSLLAATAIRHNLCLVTRNVSDFDYPNLTILNLWSQIPV
jgi:predicted nucleic acid-binding protein